MRQGHADRRTALPYLAGGEPRRFPIYRRGRTPCAPPECAGGGMRERENGRPRMLTPREAADIAGDLDEGDFDDRRESLCIRGVADEAETLTEASLMLRDFAEWLLELELDGRHLVDPRDDGHGRMVNEDPQKTAGDRT